MDAIGSYGSGGSIDHAQRRQDMFSKIDTDGDGQFSLEEFEAAKPADAPADAPAASEIFSQMDADGDGSVSEEEFSKMPPPPPPPPSGGSGMMGGDMLSSLLQALEDASSNLSEDDDDSESSTAFSEESEETDSSSTEENILELLQQELQNFRNSAHAQANNAYADASSLSTMLSAQQTFIST
ncbi:hypothetical protein MTBPR1_60107 [Candidatus Terasakiella magnetica]|uniref:EF-hand domain-containing protein n=1 Tax=Candidatus Terasakiella magnetica TaxID=1867952 RepID=A0A1C3RJY2_9PROT|nr:EF-hand domain-containing protein [Candidatus Terasakiella magnetica]SCA57594.1 hypothetical protein MTBPR1_60107 [Candidatus Terasakiella magnetica]